MAKFTRESLVEDVLKNPVALEVVEKYAPGASRNPALMLVKKFTLEKLSTIPQAGFSSEMLDRFLAEVNEKLGK